jgi:ubiquinone biosynthesis protein UbiJ
MLDAALIAGLNHLLQGAGWARDRLKPFAGRQANIGMSPFLLGFAVTPAGLFEPLPETAATDVTISLPADTPFLLPQGLDKVMAGARVEGNAEFATELSFIFRHLHWDAEEDLARLVGDIAAHRMVQSAQRIATWHRQATANLAGNLAEYLAHENRQLVTHEEFASFRETLARLNADLSRLEARCKTLV